MGTDEASPLAWKGSDMLGMTSLLVAMQQGAADAGGGCRGADMTISSATAAPARTPGLANRYTLDVTVRNIGSANQAANVLQSVSIRLDGTKNGEKGIPPLKAGQSYRFTYDVLRAAGAGRGTSTVRLRLLMLQPPGTSAQNCNAANDTARVVF